MAFFFVIDLLQFVAPVSRCCSYVLFLCVASIMPLPDTFFPFLSSVISEGDQISKIRSDRDLEEPKSKTTKTNERLLIPLIELECLL